LVSQAQSQNQSNQNKDKEGFFRPNNPLMWVSGVVLIGLVVGVVLVVRRRKRNSK
jgi:cytochrome c-type biogenesis protein CcmH/NrfF